MANFLEKFKYFIGVNGDDDYEDDLYEVDEELDFPLPAKTKRINNNVVNIHTNTSMKIVVHEPLTYEEAPKIVDDLKLRKAVVVNFQQLETELKRQIFDFINGSLYTMEGKIQKVTRDIFILAPKNVEIDGLKEELQNKGIFPW